MEYVAEFVVKIYFCSIRSLIRSHLFGFDLILETKTVNINRKTSQMIFDILAYSDKKVNNMVFRMSDIFGDSCCVASKLLFVLLCVLIHV